MMAAESKAAVHHRTPRSLLRLFDAAAGGPADWSEFDTETERWDIEVRGLSREELTTVIEGSTREIPTTEHHRLHQGLATSCGGAVGLVRDGLDAAPHRLVQPPHKVLGELDVVAVGDQAALRGAPGPAKAAPCFFFGLAADVPSLAVRPDIGPR